MAYRRRYRRRDPDPYRPRTAPSETPQPEPINTLGLLPTNPPPSMAVDVDAWARRPRLIERTIECDITEENGWHRGTKYRVVRHHFGSPEELTAHACAAYVKRGRGESDTTWAGSDFPTAVHLATAGWHDGMRAVEGLYAKLTARHTASIIPTLVYSDEPDGDVDVERWLEGEDECFLVESAGTHEVKVSGQYVNMTLDPFASCVVDTDVVLRRGVYLVALAYMLERAGYRVAITLRMPTSGEKQAWLLEIPVKEYGHVLDLPRVTFWLAHPAALRQLMIMAYRNHREDPIFSRTDNLPEGCVTAPPLVSYGNQPDLNAWLEQALKQSKLTVEDSGQ